MGFDTHILAATRLLNAQPAPSPTHPRLGRAGFPVLADTGRGSSPHAFTCRLSTGAVPVEWPLGRVNTSPQGWMSAPGNGGPRISEPVHATDRGRPNHDKPATPQPQPYLLRDPLREHVTAYRTRHGLAAPCPCWTGALLRCLVGGLLSLRGVGPLRARGRSSRGCRDAQ